MPNVPEKELTHVIPVNDWKEHECARSCWCRPTEDTEREWVMVHNSMDGREQFERGERLPS